MMSSKTKTYSIKVFTWVSDCCPSNHSIQGREFADAQGPAGPLGQPISETGVAQALKVNKNYFSRGKKTNNSWYSETDGHCKQVKKIKPIN